MIPKELLKQRPNIDDFPLQPYGYIAALTSYIEKLEQLDLTAVSQAERTVCPDCRNKGWLYDNNGNRIGTCPCHLLG
jgi:hypothetical protein